MINEKGDYFKNKVPKKKYNQFFEKIGEVEKKDRALKKRTV